MVSCEAEGLEHTRSRASLISACVGVWVGVCAGRYVSIRVVCAPVSSYSHTKHSSSHGLPEA